MLMTPPPGYSTTGYSPWSVNRQPTQRLAMPGLQGSQVTGTKPSIFGQGISTQPRPLGSFSPGAPDLSSNPLSPQNPALMNLLSRG